MARCAKLGEEDPCSLFWKHHSPIDPAGRHISSWQLHSPSDLCWTLQSVKTPRLFLLCWCNITRPPAPAPLRLWMSRAPSSSWPAFAVKFMGSPSAFQNFGLQGLQHLVSGFLTPLLVFKAPRGHHLWIIDLIHMVPFSSALIYPDQHIK